MATCSIRAEIPTEIRARKLDSAPAPAICNGYVATPVPAILRIAHTRGHARVPANHLQVSTTIWISRLSMACVLASCIEPEKAVRDHSSPLVAWSGSGSAARAPAAAQKRGRAAAQTSGRRGRVATLEFEGKVRVGRRRGAEEKMEGRGGRPGGGGSAMNLDLDRDVGVGETRSRTHDPRGGASGIGASRPGSRGGGDWGRRVRG
jgi:hypothetical protein